MSAPKTRIAYFSPLPPQRTGIADYSAELLPYLSRLYDIDVVVDRTPPAPSVPAAPWQVVATTEFSRRRSEYQAVVYQLGNSLRFHGYMVPWLSQVPGIVVLHDYSLHYLVSGVTLLNGDFHTVKEVLEPSYGSRAGAKTMSLLLGMTDPYQLPLARFVVKMSRGIIVHSEHARAQLERDSSGVPITVIPMGIVTQPLPEDRTALKVAHGFGPDDVVALSAGGSFYTKHLDSIIRTIHALRPQYPTLKLGILGGRELGARERSLIRSLGVRDAIIEFGWQEPATYRELMALADVFVDLRYPSAGETSATVLRALEVGTPLIVPADRAFLELPDSCAVKLPITGDWDAELRRALAGFLRDRSRQAPMRVAAREFVLSHARLTDAARAYDRCIRTTALAPHESSTWESWSPRPSRGVRGWVVTSAYKAGRVGSMCRQYGVAETWARIRSELRSS